jgi:hypothetical protein
MKGLHRTLAIALIGGTAALATQSALAGAPWGGNMFGIDFGQSSGYYGYPGSGSGPWGVNMFGLDFGQSTDYGSYYGVPGPYAVPPYYPQFFPTGISSDIQEDQHSS